MTEPKIWVEVNADLADIMPIFLDRLRQDVLMMPKAFLRLKNSFCARPERYFFAIAYAAATIFLPNSGLAWLALLSTSKVNHV